MSMCPSESSSEAWGEDQAGSMERCPFDDAKPLAITNLITGRFHCAAPSATAGAAAVHGTVTCI